MSRSSLLYFAWLLIISPDLTAQTSKDSTEKAGPFDARHFLWFTGHWSPSNKKVFIIDARKKNGNGIGNPVGGAGSGGDETETPGDNNPEGGGTITVDPDGSFHMKNGNTEAWNKRMDDALKSEEEYLNSLNAPGDNLDPSTKQLHDILRPASEERKQEIEGYKIGPKDDMMEQGRKQGHGSGGSVADKSQDLCKSARADYDMVMNYYKDHVKGHGNDLNVPPPPAFEYNCYACDSNVRKVYDTTIAHYIRDFMHPEDSIIKKGLDILHDMSLLGIEAGKGIDPDTYDNLFKKDKKNPSKSAPCAYMELETLANAVRDIGHHLYMRADKLVRSNHNNFKASEAIARTVLAVARDWILLSGSNENNDIYQELVTLVAKNTDFYYEELRKNDWRQIANVPFMFKLMRDNALLSGSINESFFDTYLNKILKIMNGFKLNIEMDIKVGNNNAYRLCHLKGECHIIPSIQRDSNQCYKWVVADEDKQDLLGFYKPAMLQSIDCQLIANEFTTPPQAPKITYVGTKKYLTILENLSMDFCNPGHDTIMLSGFSPKPADAGTWQFPYSYSQNLGVNGMDQFFQDLNAKKKLVDNGSAQQSEEEMKQQAEQIKQQMETLKQQMASSNANVSYEKIMEMKNRVQSMNTSATVGKMLFVDFLLPVKNNDPVLVDGKFNAKDINSKESEIIIYGTYSVHVENDGNGKPKPPRTAKTPSSGKH